MKLKELICSCCGGELIINDKNLYQCPYCGVLFEKDDAEKMQETLAAAFEKEKLDRLSNAKRVLFDATNSEYPSESKVVAAATNVLSINPNDPYALTVLYSYEENGYRLVNLLPTLKLDTAIAD